MTLSDMSYQQKNEIVLAFLSLVCVHIVARISLEKISLRPAQGLSNRKGNLVANDAKRNASIHDHLQISLEMP